MDNHHNNLNNKLNKMLNEQQRENRINYNHLRNRQHHQFFSRTVNLTEIKFTNEEMILLNNVLQYSIENPIENYRD
jgi:hypothetical protein